MRSGGLSTLLVLLAALIVLCAPAGADAESAALTPGPIDTCGTIDAPGEYVLNASVDASGLATCFDITAGDVAIDGEGHHVSGDGSGIGVFAHGTHDTIAQVTVRDITIETMAVGVRFQDVVEGAVRDSTLTQLTATGVEIRGPSARGTVIEGSAIYDNGGTGIDIAAARTSVERTAVVDNGRDGIVVASTDALLRDDTVSYNAGSGVYLDRAMRASVTDTRTEGNGAWDVADVRGTGNAFARVTLGAQTTLGATGRDYGLRGATALPAAPDAHHDIGRAVEAVVMAEGGGVDLTLAYDDAAVDGRDESSLHLWRYDGDTWRPVTGAGTWHYDLPVAAWTQVDVNDVDILRNTVTAHVDDAGVFAILDGPLAGYGPRVAVVNATMDATDIDAGDAVTIDAVVVNAAAVPIAVRVDLMAGSMTVLTRSLMIDADATRAVRFTSAFPVGTRTVSVSGADAGTLTVRAPAVAAVVPRAAPVARRVVTGRFCYAGTILDENGECVPFPAPVSGVH